MEWLRPSNKTLIVSNWQDSFPSDKDPANQKQAWWKRVSSPWQPLLSTFPCWQVFSQADSHNSTCSQLWLVISLTWGGNCFLCLSERKDFPWIFQAKKNYLLSGTLSNFTLIQFIMYVNSNSRFRWSVLSACIVPLPLSYTFINLDFIVF